VATVLDVLPHLSPDLETATAATVYVVVLGFVFVESGLLVGFLLPGDTILFGAGLVSADPDSSVSLPLLASGALVAAVAGDSLGYSIGARLGRGWVERRVTRGRLDERHLHRAEGIYDRWGWWAVVIARWVPWVRTFTPVLAGTSRMPYRRFLSANVVGALAWAVGLTVLGHLAASAPVLRRTSYAVAGLVVGCALAVGVVGWVRRRSPSGQ
jgi:membrane-associated protein